MRKRSVYILFTFIVIILFNNKLDALVCTYKNPDDPNDPSKDLVIDFSTNYKNQAYIGGEAGSRDWFKPLGLLYLIKLALIQIQVHLKKYIYMM